MNWKHEAEAELREYTTKLAAKESLAEELAVTKALTKQLTTATDKLSILGGATDREEKQLDLLVRKEKLEISYQYTCSWLKRVERSLKQLSEEELVVLESFFFHPGTGRLEGLCSLLCLEKSAVYRRRDAALLHYTKARYGIPEI